MVFASSLIAIAMGLSPTGISFILVLFSPEITETVLESMLESEGYVLAT